MAEKVVLITEQSNPIAVVDKENYVLEGIFAVFGKENVNHRIYDEKEYMPHLEYLQEKIARHKLAGELDHPEKFDISLANISHLVEKLWYDKDTRTLRGRIRILDTDPAGMNARKLVDAGFPISISSRAAGVVKDDKHVEIKRIFTYDLVADGGFGNEAELERVKESVDYNEELKSIYESASAQPNLKALKTNIESVHVYDVTDKYSEMLQEGADWSKFDVTAETKKSAKKESLNESFEINNKNNETQMANNVTVEDMAKYSRYVKEQVENLENEIVSLKESKRSNDSSRVSALEEKVNQLISFTNALVEEHNQLIKFSDKFVNEHNELSKKFSIYEKHSDEFVEEHNNLIKYAEAIAKENEQIKGYLNEEVKPTLESSIKYGEYVAKNLEECMNYLDDEVVSNFNAMHKYLDTEVSETVNNILKYQDYLAEKTNEVHAYADYLGENVASKEDLENAIGYTEYVGESLENSFKTTNLVSESNNASLDSKIDAILEGVKTKRAAKLLECSKYPFAASYTSEQMRMFNSLSEAQKEYVSKNQAGKNVDRVLNEAANLTDRKRWITDMPAEYAQAWNSLNESEKAAIEAQAEYYTLETPYQVRNFWQTRGLEEKAAQSLNESANNEVVDLGGYDSNFIEQIRKGLKKFE